MLNSAVTGDGVDMMKCWGQGEQLVANRALEVQIMYLEDDAISVNDNSVLAFSDSIEWASSPEHRCGPITPGCARLGRIVT